MNEWVIRELPTSKCPHPCVYLDSLGICNYYLITDRRRPCPPGANCTVHESGKREDASEESVVSAGRKHNRKISWDVERAKQMREEGATYQEIAKAVGVHWKTVEDYAHKFWGEKSFFRE